MSMTFPQFRGHLVEPLMSSLRARPGSDSQGSSAGAADYRTLQCTQRYPVSRHHGWHSADGTSFRLSVLKKLSMQALSQQLPLRLMLTVTPWVASNC